MRVCKLCGVDEREKRIVKSKRGMLCSICYQRETLNSTVYELPKYGEIKLNEDGKPICHICGKAYNKVMRHVCQIHGMMEKEYKKQFGLELYNGIMSEHSKNIARERALEHSDVVIKQNLLEKGSGTRFKVNSGGRTADKVSERTRKRLILNRFPNYYRNKDKENP